MREKAAEMIRAGKSTHEIVLATGITDRSIRRLKKKVAAEEAAIEAAVSGLSGILAEVRKAASPLPTELPVPPHVMQQLQAPPAAPVPPAEPTVAESVAARRQAAELDVLRRQNRQLQDALIEAQDWTARMDVLKAAKLEPVDWVAKAPHVKKANVLTPMLFGSDFQVGEVVRAEELDGMNSYNADVFCERYARMIDKTIHLSESNTGATEFPGCIYLRGGDAISGEIHEELANTNDLSSVPALRLVQRMEREGIRRLRDKFGRVRVISVPGNHGRTTFKSPHKGYAERSYETVLSWWLADFFDGDDRVKFWAPPSGDAYFKAAGWNVLMSHGDRIGSRGGAGFVGPAATIARGHQKLLQEWAISGRRPDMILTAHNHVSLKLEHGYANGSLVGYSEFARDLRAKPDVAKQWLFFMSEKEMVSHAFELHLSKRPMREGEYDCNYAFGLPAAE